MRQPSTVVLVLVFVVLLSGCSSLTGTAPNDGSEFAPGVTTDRVANATMLAETNRAILETTSYTYTRNFSQRVESEHYHYAVDHDSRVWVEVDGSYRYHHRANVTSDDGSSTYTDSVWVNESVAVMRTVNHTNESVTYARYRPPDPYPAANVTRTGIASALAGVRVTSTWNESGTAYVQVHGNESETRDWQASTGTPVALTTTRTTTATIREDGFVPTITTSVTGARPLPNAIDTTDPSTDRAIAHINDTSRVRITDLGTTRVPRPAWIDTALTATDGLPIGEPTAPREVTTNT